MSDGRRVIWVDEGLVAADHATVSVMDRGLTVGDGVFETLKVVRGVPFALSRHLDRLAASARGLGLAVPDSERIRFAVSSTLAANAADLPHESRLRITLTAGTGALGSERHGAGGTLVVAVGEAVQWPLTTAAVVVPWVRNERSAVAGLKTTSYADNVVALARAHELGAGEALFANTRGELCEGTGSNVFVVVQGRLLTPALSSGCLPGITRALVLEWVGAEELDLPVAVLGEADEVFITSSTRDVMPVDAVDGRTLDQVPGAVTRHVQEVFADRSQDDLDP